MMFQLTTWAVLPVKTLFLGKSRLAELLTPAERQEQIQTWLLHLLGVLAELPAVQQTVVVSPDPLVHHLAHTAGAVALPEPAGGGLNEAVQWGVQYVQQQVGHRVLVLPADLPLLQPADVAYFLQGFKRELRICPNLAGEGTNGLLLPVHPGFHFSFGPGSLAQHTAEGQRLGWPVTIWNIPRWQLDVDTPADWHTWQTEKKRPCQPSFFSSRPA